MDCVMDLTTVLLYDRSLVCIDYYELVVCIDEGTTSTRANLPLPPPPALKTEN